SCGLSAATARALTFSMRSSSTQPPETEPATWPSSRIATMEPTGRGAEPQVFTIVPRTARRPSRRPASALFSTSISTLSMREFYRNPAAFSARALANGHAGAMGRSDLAHDGESESAAAAGGAGHAVEALEHAMALGRRDARPVVLHLEERR